MKTYKKPVSIVIELSGEDIMGVDAVSVNIKDLDTNKVTGTQEAGITEADSKVFDSWE